MKNITLTLAWRNLWRHPRRTWLTIGAMVFSNALLVFMISLQFGMYELMIDNTLQIFTGHLQVQAPGYKDDLKMRQVVPDAAALADELRTALGIDTVFDDPDEGLRQPASKGLHGLCSDLCTDHFDR